MLAQNLSLYSIAPHGLIATKRAARAQKKVLAAKTVSLDKERWRRPLTTYLRSRAKVLIFALATASQSSGGCITSRLRVKRRWVISVGKNMPHAHSKKMRSLWLTVGICIR